MHIFVKRLDGETITVEIAADDTVEALKNKIREKSNIPVQQQRLFYQGDELEDYKTMAYYKVEKETVMSLRKSKQIFVKTLIGKTIAIEIVADDTVLALKKKIQVKEGIAPCEQSLIYAGVKLQEEKTMAFYNIQKASTIFLNLRLKGGAAPSFVNEEA